MATALALFFAPAMLAAGASTPVVNEEYEALLRRYARGERRAALAELGEWRGVDLDRQVRALERAARDGPPCPRGKDPLDPPVHLTCPARVVGGMREW